MKKLFFKNNRGFTLSEILIVVSIILILLIALAFVVSAAPKKARDTRGISDLRQIVNALELKYNEELQYPDLPNAQTQILEGDTRLQPYLDQTPSTNRARLYYWYDNGDRQKFCVYFQLEVDPNKYFSCTHNGCQISEQICPNF